MNVVVISGGFSEEQHASRKSGAYIAGALRNLGHSVTEIEYDENLASNIRRASPDAAFPIVQGKHHGDGAAAALLELMGIPYVGSRPHGAAVINHKTLCKKIWRSCGILTPDFFEYDYDEYVKSSFSDFQKKAESYGIEIPVVAKAPTQGDRFGMIFVKDVSSFKELGNAFVYDETLLVEAYVEGRFYTQGIVEIVGNMKALPPVELIDGTGDEFKVYPGGSEKHAHDFTPEHVSEISKLTLEAARLTGASGFARLDYHLSGGKLYLLEINAFPGLAPGYSSMNVCADAAGYEYDEFIGMLLETAHI